MRESHTQSALRSNRGTPKFRSRKIQLRRKRKFFRIVAKHAFPKKTAPNVRTLTGYAESSIYEWLAGRGDAPSSVLMALLGEIARDHD
jgi:predicted DNA-binding transcriptional regulator AlpA